MTAELPTIYLRRDAARPVADRLLREGAWTRVRRGAYAETPVGQQWQQETHRSLATALAVQQQLANATLADETAALAHGLAVWRIPSVTSVIQQTNPRSRLPRDIRRRVCSLDDADVVKVGPCVITSLERTIVDCARHLHPRDALVIADSGMRAYVRPLRDEHRAEVEARAEGLRSRLLARIEPRSRSAVQARAVIRAADPLAESAPESVVRWIVLSRGMPRPVLQQPVDTSRGRVFTDLAWRFQINGKLTWLHVEFDGSGKYRDDPRRRSASTVLLDERKRESAITDTGGSVVRVYWDEITMESWVFTKITQRISREAVNSYQHVPELFRPSAR